jgi:hypothetical protein
MLDVARVVRKESSGAPGQRYGFQFVKNTPAWPLRGERTLPSNRQLNGDVLVGLSRASAMRIATPVTRPTMVTSPG